MINKCSLKLLNVFFAPEIHNFNFIKVFFNFYLFMATSFDGDVFGPDDDGISSKLVIIQMIKKTYKNVFLKNHLTLYK